MGCRCRRDTLDEARCKNRGVTGSDVPTGISAITLFVEDLPATKDFYLRVFDAPVAFEDQESVAFRFDTTIVNLLDARAAPELIDPAEVATEQTGSRFQLTIHVDDVDEVCRKLADNGIELLNGPVDRPWGVRTASFKDPAGHIWELAT